MKKALIINAHLPYEFSEGKLNDALVALAGHRLASSTVRHTTPGFDVRRPNPSEWIRLPARCWSEFLVVEIGPCLGSP